MTREQRDRAIIRYVRDRAIIRYVRVYGWTYQRVADRFGVTRQRAWQIVQEGKT